ncbi:MAG: hypothetical protein CALGDGBN_00285 [Pseudomonadales bacterium]|nr:hypothetical protein [Pseudomonadales bacterium]
MIIANQEKTWEMRTRRTSIRGPIALIRAGSGQVVGSAELVDCLDALTPEQMRETHGFHGIPDSQIAEVMANNWTTPWVLRDVKSFERPVPYDHPYGAVTWVELPEIEGGNDPGLRRRTPMNAPDALPVSLARAPAPGPGRSGETATAESWIDIPLTEGNIRNGHFYLRAAERLLPPDCIGGTNRHGEAAKLLHVRFAPGGMVQTDVAGDKMILRSRAPVRDFFALSGAKPGDHVRFARTASHAFVVTLTKS